METFAQGEVYVRKLSAMPEGIETKEFTERNTNGDFIVAHSESGNHHLLEHEGVRVLERTDNVPEGMRILLAIVEAPTNLRQDAAADAHGSHAVVPGIYEMRIAREYDPLLEQARRVAD